MMRSVILGWLLLAGGFLTERYAAAEDRLDVDDLPPNLDIEVNDQAYVKTQKYSSSSSYKTVKTYSKEIYAGGCALRPTVPISGDLSCSQNSGCRAACNEGYRFPKGEREIVITCRQKKWKILGADYNQVPDCEPICLPECKNNGICSAPNECNCPENFSGPQCQFENKPCLNMPPLIKNAHRKCNAKTCTVSCLEHFSFPDGSSVANLLCKHGNWETTRSDWVTIPDCQPLCSPPCQNQGVCLPLNTCQCPKDFRGPQCQYRADACAPGRLSFNGGFRCSSAEDHSYACTLDCPEGAPFEFPPAARYVCRYATGRFEPQPVPQCVPPAGGSLVSLGGYEQTTYRNRSFNVISTGSYEAGQSSYEKHRFSGSFTYQGANSIEDGVRTEGGSNQVVGGESLIGSGTHVVSGARLPGGVQVVTGTQIESENTVGTSQHIEIKPQGGSCFSWSGAHYQTFDGQVFSFESKCAYTLVKDVQDGLFSVSIRNDCEKGKCSRQLRIFVQGKEYSLSRGSTGQPEFRNARKTLAIPTQLTHLRVEQAGGQFLLASLDAVGLKLHWDGGDLVQAEASESLWNRTSGLCGNLNGRRDDLHRRRPTKDWRIEDIGEKCEEDESHHQACLDKPKRDQEAKEFCTNLLADSRYKTCGELVDLSGFVSACQWDYCSCNDTDPRQCACDTMEVYVRQCAHKGLVSLSGWRNSSVCPMKCDNGKVYESCGPRSQPICGADLDDNYVADLARFREDCEEGCFCPSGTVLHENRCIQPAECPCRLRGKSFAAGASIVKDCNTCNCERGQWRCTESKCAGRCSAVGDPHYTTFDGKKFDFMGECSYYLVKGEDYSVEAENALCSSAISEMMGFTRSYKDGEPTCTKTVTIRQKDVAIKLKQNRQILVNGEDVSKLPMLAGGAKVRVVSSIFIGVTLPNGLEVMWDGVSRVYINAPADLRGKTKGLCGTFTANQKDDFLTPDGDVEQAVVPFANKWKTSEQCTDIKKDSDHPCDVNPQKRTAAENYCSVIRKKLFSGCHWHVDPEPFYKDCMYDMCACEANVETCFCPILAAYAKDCAHAGVVLPWRQEVRECQIHCSGDQEYQTCGNSCARSCADISFHPECKQECVEGCNCPAGLTLNVNGDCIPIGQCPCTHAGFEFPPGYREVRPGVKGQELCFCAGGLWNCQLASPDDIQSYPAIEQLKGTCSATQHLEMTTCEPLEPRTCRTMHQRVDQTPAVCRPGCVCKAGYVLDAPSGRCVREQDCPCYHGGRSYREGTTMQEECNTCKCNAGRWNCTDIVCPGVCSVWGDSHYSTFDDRRFDFQGVCDYVLAKGKLSDAECFDVSIRNVACGTTGVTCSKSITLTVGKESVTLTRGKNLDTENLRNLGRIAIRRAGLFVFLDVPDLGLVVQWDEGTRAYVRLDARWRGRTKGLCGDFNGDAADDFKTPSGGVSEASANLFADSWKMSDLCAEPTNQQKDACTRRPERRLWSSQRCRIIKSEIFAPCHSEVAPEDFLERCVQDACACDDGGDCECLCTAVAAYAHECNARGVPIKWRSQKFCPMQCDEACSEYSSCVSTCPRETCENLATRGSTLHLCDQDTCVEGCKPRACPEGQVYLNSSFNDCVPRGECRVPCTVVNGIQYYEGDKVSEDDCHACFCSLGKVSCKGDRCDDPLPLFPIITLPPAGDEKTKCISGWTNWINTDIPKREGFRSDIEEIPTLIELQKSKAAAVCDRDKNEIIDIKCRTVDQKLSYKEVELDYVECSVEKGLMCLPPKGSTCPDFEINVLCSCVGDTSSTTPADLCELSEPYHGIADCTKYEQCSPTPNGNRWITKVCNPGTWFNEKLQICDWPNNVEVTRPECAASEGNVRGLVHSQCKEGEHWSDCAIKCSRTCSYYRLDLERRGICNKTTDCVPGCIPNNRVDCLSDDFLWVNNETCAHPSTCICATEDGEPVRPGKVVKFSECKICQCLNNFYSCDDSACKTSTTSQSVTAHTPIPPIKHHTDKEDVVLSTTTPPPPCFMGYSWLLEKSPADVKYEMSSDESDFMPGDKLRLLNVSSFTSWQPKVNDLNQWVKIILPKPVPIYGVEIGGDQYLDRYVTSYKILFSEDGIIYSYIIEPNNDKPQEFRGPIDASKPVRQMFHEPIEAKIVKIVPLTWHNGISMQVELIGCNDVSSTSPLPSIPTLPPTTEITPVIPVCDDKMGYDDQLMSDQQVSVSSDASSKVRLSSPEVWRPTLDNPDQYVQFDFQTARNLTGVETKGGNGIWTTAYKVYYGADGRYWNPVIDSNGAPTEFLGNVDDYNSKVNYFVKPIGARFLKIVPTRWHEHIGLKAEIRGCYLPYEVVPEVVAVPLFIPPPVSCNVCKGIIMQKDQSCHCEENAWWDGRSCVDKQQCPCVVGHVSYAVGSSFETPDCEQCDCAIGGTKVCHQKICERCPMGERSVLTELCSCLCKSCPQGQRLCPSTDVCIDNDKWCNGIVDCPDDEIDCEMLKIVNETESTFNKISKINIVCVTECPPGFTKVEQDFSDSLGSSSAYLNITYQQTITYHSSFKQEIIRKKIPPPMPSFQSRFGEEDVLCPKFDCKPIERVEDCQKILCPEGFQPKYDQTKSYRNNKICDNACVPIPINERVCTLIGRSFTTFDDLLYKYDICNHILARDRDENKWFITVEKVCEAESMSCQQKLVLTFDTHVVELRPDMHVVVDAIEYNANEVVRLGDSNPWLKLSLVGNALRVESRRYPIWGLLEVNGVIKVGVSEELASHVDGLCGLLDGNPHNDRITPSGVNVQSTQEFGDSWKMLDTAECKLQECPREKIAKAWKMCNLLKDTTFDACSGMLNREKFVSSCLETSCRCLSSANSTTQSCRCSAISTFVTECLAADKNIDLTSWRTIYDCPAFCQAPFVHKDCFRNKCEMSCENLQEMDPCPVKDGLCVPGCFCPDGTVRNGDTCVPPTECRNCICNGLGNSKYVTYDKNNLVFNGNCSYILSRSMTKGKDGKHIYEVLVSNGACDDGVCTEAITILYKKHIIQIRKDNTPKQLITVVDEEQIYQYPYITPWLKLEKTQNQDVNLLIIPIQLELVSFSYNFAFTLRLPSHTFGGAMEGLCGNCNLLKYDDYKTPDGKFTEDPQEFGNSWQAKDLPASLNLNDQHCSSSLNKVCLSGASSNQICERLLKPELFGRCHGFVDPTPYYLACKDSICEGGNPCANFEAYARSCSFAGICLDWRAPDLCPFYCDSYLEYRACGSGCPVTCESLNSQNQEKCLAGPVEGCFCPAGQVLHNGNCVPERNCFVCDDQGHLEGDFWQPDKCTQCSCQQRHVQCQKMSCPAYETICLENFNKVVVPGTENDCCPKHMCVSVTPEVPNCIEAQQPECGYAQVLKISVDATGCRKFICQCVPEDQCVALDIEFWDNAELEPGFVKVTNYTGCCPKTSKMCKPETCPEAPRCEKYYKQVLKEVSDSCCSKIECELPKDLCLYYLEASGEWNSVDKVVAKNIGEEWSDGNCKTCTCELKDGLPTSTCTTKECLNLFNHPDFNDYVLEQIVVNDQCCPNFKRVGCKHADHIYQQGDKWNPNPHDTCTTTICSPDTNGVIKRMIVQECTTVCEPGYEYRPSADKSISCCGECVAVACVLDGQTKRVGETWYSDDYCSKSACVATNETLHVQVAKETCQIVDLVEEKNYKIVEEKVPGQCCPIIKRAACLSDGTYYEPGQSWKSSHDSCIEESCTLNESGKIIKQKQTKTCNQNCPKGWEYQLPEFGTCCGECKQIYCIVDDLLYPPGKVWYSDDNCTTYECAQTSDQLFVSTSTPVCPVLDCSPEKQYHDGCCKKCQITNENIVVKEEEACLTDVIDFQKTVGIIVEKKGAHGVCKNLMPIHDLAECNGRCKSTSQFDKTTWEHIIECKCCQPIEYKKITVELTCEDKKKFKKILSVPTRCSCDSCSSDKSKGAFILSKRN